MVEEYDENCKVDKSNILSLETASVVKSIYGTPVYVYSRKILISQARKALSFPNSFGLKVRFAVKSCPNAAIIQIFNSIGICFDASSGYEVERLVRAGVKPTNISLSSQEIPSNFKQLVEMGIEYNACSLHQLKNFGLLFPGTRCGVRFNPGKGSGGNGKTNVGGPTSSFGIWYELIDEVKQILMEHNLTLDRIHTHIGSGSDPLVWQQVAALSLSLVNQFPDVVALNLGGGFKVGRMASEKSTDLQDIGTPVMEAFQIFAQDTGRHIKLEIEPGTYLVANAGALLSTVQDIVSTDRIDNEVEKGYTFLKLDCGMTEVLRPSLYGAQHPIVLLSTSCSIESVSETAKYIVVGHCCESGDLFTCAPGQPDVLQERVMPKAAIGDMVSIEGTGAYCASMSTKNYNSFPEAPEVLIDSDGITIHLIRRRQTLEHMLANEIALPIT